MNDDWSYALSVENILNFGKFEPIGWASMTLLTQSVWGALFSYIFGFSHTVLRVSTLFLSLIGIVVIYFTIRKFGGNRFSAMFGAFATAFNPLYFSLSFTFMIDVPFAVFCILSLYFFMSAIEETGEKFNRALFLGTIFSILATLDRQIGVFLPISFSISYLLTWGLRKRNLFYSLVPLVATYSALKLFEHWLSENGLVPAMYGLQIGTLLNVLSEPYTVFTHLFVNGFFFVMYEGLFLSPLLSLWLFSGWNENTGVKRSFLAGLVMLSVGVVFLYVYKGLAMPYLGNVLTSEGIGPFTLRDSYILGVNLTDSSVEKTFTSILTLLSILGGASLLAFFVEMFRTISSKTKSVESRKKAALFRFLLIGLAIYMAPILLIGGFDRYLIVPLTILSIMIALKTGGRNKKFAKTVGAILLSLFMVFSTLSTHDYLSWNRQRWDALKSLMAAGVEPSDIDGGFKFNGYYMYNPGYSRKSDKSWWWVENDEYMVTFSKLDGFGVVEEYEVDSWLPFVKYRIFVLRRL